ncbi:MAG: hypothetical protein Q9217_006318 [Psora testacea]
MRRSAAMMSYNIGQILRGRNALYTINTQLRNRPEGPWLATGPNQERIIMKTAPTKHLDNEARTLQLFQGCPSIRQLVDQIEDPESVVLEYMDDNVLNLLQQKQLVKVEAKRAIQATIEALIALHDKNIVHTDIKPDNILVKYGPWGTQYKLSDFGDSAPPNVPSNDGGHLIGAEIFCAPEVPLGIPWTTKADIWAVGATGITLITGNYIFLPQNAPPTGDPRLSMGVLQMQNDYYGPIGSEAFKDLIDDSVRPLLLQFEENYRPFSLAAASRNITQKDIDFFDYIMKVDPRQRPTAREALRHPWFNEV